jgi:hypothetical protein
MIMWTLWFLMLPIRTAFYMNVRGNNHVWGTTLNRLLFGLYLGGELTVISAFWQLPSGTGALCGLLAFVGVIVGNSSESQDNIESHEGMSILMTGEIGLILAPIIYHLHWVFPFALFGVLGGFAYWLGYRMKKPLMIGNWEMCSVDDVTWGEFYNGLFTLGLPLMILGLCVVYS